MDAKQIDSLIYSSNDIAFRHGNKDLPAFNAGFLDGHVDTLSDLKKVRLKIDEKKNVR